MNLYQTASAWVAAGVAVIPLCARDKRPDAAALKLTGDLDEDGRPAWGKYKSALPTRAELYNWFCGPARNYGVVTGWTGLVVVDFDSLDFWGLWADWAGVYAPHACLSYSVLTGRGVHVYLRTTEPTPAARAEGLDIKAAGGYVLGAGCIHPSGRVYTAVDPTANIVTVNSLTEVLPFELHPADTDEPALAHVPAAQLPDDPWERADHPAVASGPCGGAAPSIAEQLRLRVRAHTRWTYTRCPFHDDKQESFWVDTRKGLCGCFAGCLPKPLDAVGLYARLHGISNRDAWQMFGGRNG